MEKCKDMKNRKKKRINEQDVKYKKWKLNTCKNEVLSNSFVIFNMFFFSRRVQRTKSIKYSQSRSLTELRSELSEILTENIWLISSVQPLRTLNPCKRLCKRSICPHHLPTTSEVKTVQQKTQYIFKDRLGPIENALDETWRGLDVMPTEPIFYGVRSVRRDSGTRNKSTIPSQDLRQSSAQLLFLFNFNSLIIYHWNFLFFVKLISILVLFVFSFVPTLAFFRPFCILDTVGTPLPLACSKKRFPILEEKRSKSNRCSIFLFSICSFS